MSIPICEKPQVKSAIPPIEQDPEFIEVMRKIRESRLQKAGLRGCYLTAKSELGDEVCKLVSAGCGVYLFGQPGRGKTYAAAQAVRIATERAPINERAAQLISSKHLLDGIKAGYGLNQDTQDMLTIAEKIPVLALDDLGAERPTDWAIETLSSIIDVRTAAGLPIIITSNFSLGELRELWGGMPGARVASRIAGACKRIEVTGKDRRFDLHK